MSDQTNQTTQSKPKTREEWESEVIGLLNSLAARKPITDELVSLVDAIMSLQDEAERLRAIVAEVHSMVVQAGIRGEFVPTDFIRSAIEKARQAK